MKKVKESVQNSALAILKGRDMVFNAYFRSGIFSLTSKESDESDQLFSPGFYGEDIRKFVTRLLTKKINSRKRNQNTTTKTNAANITDTTCTCKSLLYL